MSRSGYTDGWGGEEWNYICYRGAVSSALRGKRGQAFLQELADALDALPNKRLIAEYVEHEGEFCTLGVIANTRGTELPITDPDDWHELAPKVADSLGIAPSMVLEIVFLNDEHFLPETPEQRWTRMRKWIQEQVDEQTRTAG